MPKILFFGDVFGRPGREALRQALPGLREKYTPDLVVANVENLAHGKGMTQNTLNELQGLVDVFTGGNHSFDKEVGMFNFPQILRPANYKNDLPGVGVWRGEKGGHSFCVVNINGLVYFEREQERLGIRNPFLEVDLILKREAKSDDIILVDFHADATSEKTAMGFYLDGRVAAVVGTHSHVPTADFRILPKGTAYVTDLGMCGPLNSVIGSKPENALRKFLEEGSFFLEPEEVGPATVNGLFVETKGNKAVRVEKIYEIV